MYKIKYELQVCKKQQTNLSLLNLLFMGFAYNLVLDLNLMVKITLYVGRLCHTTSKITCKFVNNSVREFK